eukprot:11660924-Karenia_brevis.AAC.1
MADVADDGDIGGEHKAVLKALKGEIDLGQEYGVRHNFSKMVLYVLSGHEFQGNLQEFRDLGVQVPVVGDAEFVRDW